jgi:type IV pilus assembly protein PilB
MAMTPPKRKRLGEVLREKGKISDADLSRAIQEQQVKLVHLGEVLFESGQIEKGDLVKALEEVTRIPYVDCMDVTPDRAAIELVPRALAERCCALPLHKEGKRLVVVLAKPQDLALIEQLSFSTGGQISPRMGFRTEILSAIGRAYATPEAPAATDAAISANLEIDEPDDDIQKMEFVSTSTRLANREAFEEVQAELLTRKSPAVRVVSEIISAAMAKDASDIHVEPQADSVVVRIRVDGVLRDLRQVPRVLQNSLISRIKILSDMDIAERRSPQDGRFLVKTIGRQLDMRISTLPTQYGEKVVMRLLDPSSAMRTLSDLGLGSDLEGKLAHLLSLPQGTLLVTGPTGSGKTTTLYAALNLLRSSEVNIVTVEDPVEYVLPGINQVHVNTKAGLTFASVVRSILRQDPNIIMVGEIRDKETAEICMRAAQTGHVVLSTLHTNDSVSAIVRLLDLGIAGYLIGSSVTGILAQRLVRRLCSCSTQLPADHADAEEFLATGAPVGCPECDMTGYKGRVGVYELLVVDDTIRNLVRDSDAHEIRDWVRSQGTRTMQDDAIDKIERGITTLEEVQRVVRFESGRAIKCAKCRRDIGATFTYCPYCGTGEPARRKNRHTNRNAFPRAWPADDREEKPGAPCSAAQQIPPCPRPSHVLRRLRRRRSGPPAGPQ